MQNIELLLLHRGKGQHIGAEVFLEVANPADRNKGHAVFIRRMVFDRDDDK